MTVREAGGISDFLLGHPQCLSVRPDGFPDDHLRALLGHRIGRSFSLLPAQCELVLDIGGGPGDRVGRQAPSPPTQPFDHPADGRLVDAEVPGHFPRRPFLATTASHGRIEGVEGPRPSSAAPLLVPGGGRAEVGPAHPGQKCVDRHLELPRQVDHGRQRRFDLASLDLRDVGLFGAE